MEYSLKKSLVDPIFSELEKGEKIIAMNKIPERMIPELHQIESRLEITVIDLVRCKDCRYGIPKSANTVLCCYDNVIGRIKHEHDFCSDGRKKNDQ